MACLPLILVALLSCCAGRPEEAAVTGSGQQGNGRPAQIVAALRVLNRDYVAVRSSSTEIDVNPSSKSGDWKPAQLNAYQAKMSGVRQQIKADGSIPATITMKRALSLGEFESFVSRYGVTVEGYQLRRLERLPDGKYERLTLMSAPKRGKLIPDGLAELSGSPHFIGVTAVYGKLPGDAYARISKDKRVFVADITALLLKQQLLGNKRIEDMTADNKIKIDVNVPNLYWELEEAGIVRYDVPIE